MLTTERAEKFARFYREISPVLVEARAQRTEKAKHWQVALKRFEIAAQRRDAEDKLLDLVTGLEALFGDDSGEITYKLSMRLAAMLGMAKHGSPGSVHELMHRIYSLRSKIVHGSRFLGEDELKWLRDGSVKLVDDLRVCLAVYLLTSRRVNGFGKNSLISLLDSWMLHNADKNLVSETRRAASLVEPHHPPTMLLPDMDDDPRQLLEA